MVSPFSCNNKIWLCISTYVGYAIAMDEVKLAQTQVTPLSLSISHYSQLFDTNLSTHELKPLGGFTCVEGCLPCCAHLPSICELTTSTTTPAPTTSTELNSASTTITVTTTITQPCNFEPLPSCLSLSQYISSLTRYSTDLHASPTRETILQQPSQVPQSNTESTSENNEECLNNNNSNDVTNCYWRPAISGKRPSIIPLVIKSGSNEPITLLTGIDTTQPYSFISSTLVSYLSLTSKITPGLDALQSATKIGPEDLQTLLGFNTTFPGILTMGVITGRNKKHLPDRQFVVFDAPDRLQGPVLIDIRVGTDFLNAAKALKLTDEYAHQPAPEGLGIVVQRVFVTDGKADKAHTEHTEL